MKTLLLDAGNTRLKWALCEDGQLSQQDSLCYEGGSFSTRLDASLGKLLADTGPLVGVTMSNVAGEKLATVLQEKLQAYATHVPNAGGKPVRESVVLSIKNVAAQKEAFGVRCAYENPIQLGADRWAALVAARRHGFGASCIIDCGTATTIDVLTADGQHAGGIILPGMETMKSSLVDSTDGVFTGECADTSVLAVTNTKDAVQVGVIAAQRGAVQQVLQQCREAFGETPTCVLTGGDAKWLLPGLPETTKLEPDWVLKGLAIISAGGEE